MVVGGVRHLERRGETNQVEQRAPHAAHARGDVADLTAGDVQGHDLLFRVVGVAGALDSLGEFLNCLLSLSLLTKDVAQLQGLADNLAVKRLPVARFEVQQRGVRDQLLHFFVELFKALAGDDHVRVGGDDGFQVRLAVVADVEDVLVVRDARDGIGHDVARRGDRLNAPRIQKFEGAVVQGDYPLRRAGHGLLAVVVGERHGAFGSIVACRRPFGRHRFRTSGGIRAGLTGGACTQREGAGRNKSDERGTGETGHGRPSFQSIR